jgi:hypothetical protein
MAWTELPISEDTQICFNLGMIKPESLKNAMIMCFIFGLEVGTVIVLCLFAIHKLGVF